MVLFAPNSLIPVGFHLQCDNTFRGHQLSPKILGRKHTHHFVTIPANFIIEKYGHLVFGGG
jgi:hypothetical protein